MFVPKIAEYFLDPKTEGYTIPKTFTYSIFFLIIIFLLYQIIKKFKIKIDEKFFASFVPYIILGSTIRVLEDYQIISGLFFVTPWIQIIFLVPLIFFFLLTKKINQRKIEKIFLLISTILLGVALTYLPIKNFAAIVYISISISILLFLTKIIPTSFFNKLLVFFVMLEVIVTIINVKVFDFYEQHIVTRYLLENFPLLYPITRVVFLFLLIKITDTYYTNKTTNSYIKLVFIVISFMISVRNTLQVIACC